MPKTISVSEAKNRLRAILEWADNNQDVVVVESGGRPKAVILPFSKYEAYLPMREREQRSAVVERLEELAALVQAQNQDMSPDEANQLADEISGETLNRMLREGKVIFKQTSLE